MEFDHKAILKSDHIEKINCDQVIRNKIKTMSLFVLEYISRAFLKLKFMSFN